MSDYFNLSQHIRNYVPLRSVLETTLTFCNWCMS